MRSVRAGRRLLPALFALFVSVTVAGQALASGWSEPYLLAQGASDVGSSDFVILDGPTVLAVYGIANESDVARILTRRSDDSGVTWGSPHPISNYAYWPAVSGRGVDVDLVWQWNGRVQYVHSGDKGHTFSAPKPITQASAYARYPRVARGPDGIVAVAWEQAQAIWARVSLDGGVTFGRAAKLAADGLLPRLAIGDGVVYVVSTTRSVDTITVNRSSDAGATWTTTKWPVAWLYDAAVYTVSAEGSQAVVLYHARSTLRMRVTRDAGLTWSGTKQVLPDKWGGGSVRVNLSAGVIRAVFVGRRPGTGQDAIFYIENRTGHAWSSPVRLSQPHAGLVYAREVGFAGKTVAMYWAWPDTGREGLFVTVRR